MKNAKRSEVFSRLIEPIKLDYTSSIRARQNGVSSRHEKLLFVYPFLNDEEKALADQWFKDNKFSGLWD